MNGRKDGIVHDILRMPEYVDNPIVWLRCRKEGMFGTLYGRGYDPPLHGAFVVTPTEDDTDCMACIVARLS